MAHGTTTSPSPALAADLQFVTRQGERYVIVSLLDGRILALPLGLYPVLQHATAKQRANWQIIGRGRGFHWPELDLDLSVAGMLAGTPDMTTRARNLRRAPRVSRWVVRRAAARTGRR